MKIKKAVKPVEKFITGYLIFYQDRWGHRFISVRNGKNIKSYKFVGFKGRHRVRLFNPNVNDRRLVFEAEIVSSK